MASPRQRMRKVRANARKAYQQNKRFLLRAAGLLPPKQAQPKQK